MLLANYSKYLLLYSQFSIQSDDGDYDGDDDSDGDCDGDGDGDYN